ncbi:MAG: fatty acid desaturase [Pirellulaceae bacterium]
MTSLPHQQAGPRTASAAGPTLILWAYAIPIAAIHALALLVLVPWLFSWSGALLGVLGVHLFGNLGINLGYHRLLSHRSFRTPQWLERTFVVIALCCLQDTPIRWVATHRLHHNHADGPEDPHSPLQNFLWGHMGWLFRRSPTLHDVFVYQRFARDLMVDPFYLYLEKRPWLSGTVYLFHALGFFLVGAAAGWLFTGSPAAGLQLGLSWLVWGVIARTVAVWHITWSVNSLTHLFGYRTYATDENSRNNWLVALLSAGEGWHNNHHWDPASASVQHRWWEIDFSYYTIRTLERVGLARDVVRTRHVRRQAAPPAELATKSELAATAELVATGEVHQQQP